MDKREKLEELVELASKAREKSDNDLSFKVEDDEIIGNLYGTPAVISIEDALEKMSSEEIEEGIEKYREMLEESDIGPD